MDAALQDLSLLNVDAAYRALAAVRRGWEPHGDDHELWLRATLAQAMAAYALSPATPERVSEAVGLYALLLENTQDPGYAARAWIELGRIAEVRDFADDLVDLERARGHYRQVLDEWPESRVADEAALWYAGTYVRNPADEESVRAGVAFLESWATARPDSAYRSVYFEWLGWVQRRMLGDSAAAVAALRRAVDAGIVDPTALPMRYWTIASLSENELDDPATAVEFYRRVILEAPRSGRTFEAQLALRRLAAAHPELNVEVPELINPLKTTGSAGASGAVDSGDTTREADGPSPEQAP